VVTDIERSRRFYGQMMDVAEVARLSDRESDRRGETALLFSAGKARWACVSSTARGSAADRWLTRHPDGVRTVAFQVRDVERARRVLGERGATACSELESAEDHQGRPYRWLDIATPLGRSASASSTI
jgi:4-hydroxyphenylpyruvate dioxygenase